MNAAYVQIGSEQLARGMDRSIAGAHGTRPLRATFTPKPFPELTGSGCHAHVSLWQRERNLFADRAGELGLSQLGYQFLAGVLGRAEALCALTNPTVDGHKRINAAMTLSGATWSPNTVTYGGNNRTHMIRVPDAGRFELRLADGAANPYLLQAGLLEAVMDGIASGRDPGERLDISMYTQGHTVAGVRRPPLNLNDALRTFEASTSLGVALGEEFVRAYVAMKMLEWHDYASQITAWERETTLDAR